MRKMGHDLIWLKVAMATAAVITFSYTTFATKEQIKESVLDRLDRIEIKIDRLIEER